jgi:hypothetical protein
MRAQPLSHGPDRLMAGNWLAVKTELIRGSVVTRER